MRMDLIVRSAGRGGIQADKVAGQEINRACRPCMAQRLAEGIAVHRVLLFKGLSGVVFLPEGDRAELQHAAPVAPDLFEHLLKIPHAAERLQLKEAEIRGGDGRHFFIEKNTLDKKLSALLVRNPEENRQNIGVARDVPVSGSEGVDIGTFFRIPEIPFDLLKECSTLCLIR